MLGKIGKAISNATSSMINPGGAASSFGSASLGQLDGNVLDFIPGIGDARAQDKANKINKQENIANRDWMERMSNSAYQRAMDDMKKAGLNPMLAYQQGGASVPTNTAPVAEAASKTRLADAALGAYTGISAAHTQRQQANTAQAQAQSTVALQATQATQNAAQSVKTQAETEKVKEQIKSEKVRRKLDEKNVPLASVTESAAGLAQKGVSTLQKVSDSILKNTAKPRVNPRTLQYEKPWYEKLFSNPADNLRKHIKR